MKSLRDQLLKTGLTDSQSVKNVRKQKQKQNKKPKSQRGLPSETSQQIAQAQQQKVRKDQELNRQRQAEREQKAMHAQIVQLVEHSKIEAEEADFEYNFTHNNKIKKLWVSKEQQQLLSRGKIAIVTLAETEFALVPKTVADKITQRDASLIIQNSAEEVSSNEDDPYADYQIPDDLQW